MSSWLRPIWGVGDSTGRGLTPTGRYDLSQFGRYVRFRTRFPKGPRFEGEKRDMVGCVKVYALKICLVLRSAHFSACFSCYQNFLVSLRAREAPARLEGNPIYDYEREAMGSINSEGIY